MVCFDDGGFFFVHGWSLERSQSELIRKPRLCVGQGMSLAALIQPRATGLLGSRRGKFDLVPRETSCLLFFFCDDWLYFIITAPIAQSTLQEALPRPAISTFLLVSQNSI